MKNLQLISETDEMFGNTWSTNLIFKDGTNEYIKGKRPVQYIGVHGVVNLFKNEFHLLSEDDGNFQTIIILTKEELKQLYTEMSSLVNEFVFEHNHKARYKNQNILKNRKSGKNKLSSLVITDRLNIAPLLDIGVKGKIITFDVAWLPDFVSVLDID